MTEPALAPGCGVCTQTGFADGETVVGFRTRLREWLDATVDITPERACDIVLATDEALANVVDHAYQDHGDRRDMQLDAFHDPRAATVTVRISDQGRWQEPAAVPVTSPRGRGLTLMQALSDACSVDGRTNGTAVSLRFDHCPSLEDSAVRIG